MNRIKSITIVIALFISTVMSASPLADDIILQNKFDSSFKEFISKECDAEIVKLKDGQALKITSGALKKWIKLPAGESVEFSVMVKTENVRRNNPKQHWCGAIWGVMMRKDGKKDEKWVFPGVRSSIGNTSWQRKTFKIDVPLGGDISVLLRFGLSGATGTVYYKDLMLKILK
jgi:hypothetical protein